MSKRHPCSAKCSKVTTQSPSKKPSRVLPEPEASTGVTQPYISDSPSFQPESYIMVRTVEHTPLSTVGITKEIKVKPQTVYVSKTSNEATKAEEIVRQKLLPETTRATKPSLTTDPKNLSKKPDIASTRRPCARLSTEQSVKETVIGKDPEQVQTIPTVVQQVPPKTTKAIPRTVKVKSEQPSKEIAKSDSTLLSKNIRQPSGTKKTAIKPVEEIAKSKTNIVESPRTEQRLKEPVIGKDLLESQQVQKPATSVQQVTPKTTKPAAKTVKVESEVPAKETAKSGSHLKEDDKLKQPLKIVAQSSKPTLTRDSLQPLLKQETVIAEQPSLEAANKQKQQVTPRTEALLKEILGFKQPLKKITTYEQPTTEVTKYKQPRTEQQLKEVGPLKDVPAKAVKKSLQPLLTARTEPQIKESESLKQPLKEVAKFEQPAKDIKKSEHTRLSKDILQPSQMQIPAVSAKSPEVTRPPLLKESAISKRPSIPQRIELKETERQSLKELAKKERPAKEATISKQPDLQLRSEEHLKEGKIWKKPLPEVGKSEEPSLTKGHLEKRLKQETEKHFILEKTAISKQPSVTKTEKVASSEQPSRIVNKFEQPSIVSKIEQPVQERAKPTTVLKDVPITRITEKSLDAERPEPPKIVGKREPPPITPKTELLLGEDKKIGQPKETKEEQPVQKTAKSTLLEEVEPIISPNTDQLIKETEIFGQPVRKVEKPKNLSIFEEPSVHSEIKRLEDTEKPEQALKELAISERSSNKDVAFEDSCALPGTKQQLAGPERLEQTTQVEVIENPRLSLSDEFNISEKPTNKVTFVDPPRTPETDVQLKFTEIPKRAISEEGKKKAKDPSIAPETKLQIEDTEKPERLLDEFKISEKPTNKATFEEPAINTETDKQLKYTERPKRAISEEVTKKVKDPSITPEIKLQVEDTEKPERLFDEFEQTTKKVTFEDPSLTPETKLQVEDTENPKPSFEEFDVPERLTKKVTFEDPFRTTESAPQVEDTERSKRRVTFEEHHIPETDLKLEDTEIPERTTKKVTFEVPSITSETNLQLEDTEWPELAISERPTKKVTFDEPSISLGAERQIEDIDTFKYPKRPEKLLEEHALSERLSEKVDEGIEESLITEQLSITIKTKQPLEDSQSPEQSLKQVTIYERLSKKVEEPVTAPRTDQLLKEVESFKTPSKKVETAKLDLEQPKGVVKSEPLTSTPLIQISGIEQPVQETTKLTVLKENEISQPSSTIPKIVQPLNDTETPEAETKLFSMTEQLLKDTERHVSSFEQQAKTSRTAETGRIEPPLKELLKSEPLSLKNDLTQQEATRPMEKPPSIRPKVEQPLKDTEGSRPSFEKPSKAPRTSFEHPPTTTPPLKDTERFEIPLKQVSLTKGLVLPSPVQKRAIEQPTQETEKPAVLKGIVVSKLPSRTAVLKSSTSEAEQLVRDSERPTTSFDHPPKTAPPLKGTESFQLEEVAKSERPQPIPKRAIEQPTQETEKPTVSIKNATSKPPSTSTTEKQLKDTEKPAPSVEHLPITDLILPWPMQRGTIEQPAKETTNSVLVKGTEVSKPLSITRKTEQPLKDIDGLPPTKSRAIEPSVPQETSKPVVLKQIDITPKTAPHLKETDKFELPLKEVAKSEALSLAEDLIHPSPTQTKSIEKPVQEAAKPEVHPSPTQTKSIEKPVQEAAKPEVFEPFAASKPPDNTPQTDQPLKGTEIPAPSFKHPPITPKVVPPLIEPGKFEVQRSQLEKITIAEHSATEEFDQPLNETEMDVTKSGPFLLTKKTAERPSEDTADHSLKRIATKKPKKETDESEWYSLPYDILQPLPKETLEPGPLQLEATEPVKFRLRPLILDIETTAYDPKEETLLEEESDGKEEDQHIDFTSDEDKLTLLIEFKDPLDNFGELEKPLSKTQALPGFDINKREADIQAFEESIASLIPSETVFKVEKPSSSEQEFGKPPLILIDTRESDDTPRVPLKFIELRLSTGFTDIVERRLTLFDTDSPTEQFLSPADTRHSISSMDTDQSLLGISRLPTTEQDETITQDEKSGDHISTSDVDEPRIPSKLVELVRSGPSPVLFGHYKLSLFDAGPRYSDQSTSTVDQDDHFSSEQVLTSATSEQVLTSATSRTPSSSDLTSLTSTSYQDETSTKSIKKPAAFSRIIPKYLDGSKLNEIFSEDHEKRKKPEDECQELPNMRSSSVRFESSTSTLSIVESNLPMYDAATQMLPQSKSKIISMVFGSDYETESIKEEPKKKIRFLFRKTASPKEKREKRKASLSPFPRFKKSSSTNSINIQPLIPANSLPPGHISREDYFYFSWTHLELVQKASQQQDLSKISPEPSNTAIPRIIVSTPEDASLRSRSILQSIDHDVTSQMSSQVRPSQSIASEKEILSIEVFPPPDLRTDSFTQPQYPTNDSTSEKKSHPTYDPTVRKKSVDIRVSFATDLSSSSESDPEYSIVSLKEDPSTEKIVSQFSADFNYKAKRTDTQNALEDSRKSLAPVPSQEEGTSKKEAQTQSRSRPIESNETDQTDEVPTPPSLSEDYFYYSAAFLPRKK